MVTRREGPRSRKEMVKEETQEPDSSRDGRGQGVLQLTSGVDRLLPRAPVWAYVEWAHTSWASTIWASIYGPQMYGLLFRPDGIPIRSSASPSDFTCLR